MICDYCPEAAVWYATAESTTTGMTRLACRCHVDQARRDCSVIAQPNVLEIVDHIYRDAA